MGTRRRRSLRPCAAYGVVAAALLIATARGDLDLHLESGDRVNGSLDPPSQVETFRIDVPRGADVRVRASARAAPLAVALSGPDATPLAADDGRAVGLRATAATSGLHAVTVRSANGVTPTDYRVHVTWRTRTTLVEHAALAAGGDATLRLPLDAGSRVRLRVAAAHGSRALPSLDAITPPGTGAAHAALGKRGVAAFTAGATGEHEVDVSDRGAAGGDVLLTARVRPPRRARRVLRATYAELPPSVEILGAAVVDAAGARVAVAGDSALAASRVDIPAGAFARPTLVALGRGADLDPLPPQRAEAAGRALVVCPVERTFDAATAPRVDVAIAVPTPAREGAVLRMFAQRPRAAPVALGPSDVSESAGGLAAPAAAFGTYQPYWVLDPEIPPPFRLDGDAIEGLGTSVATAGRFVLAGAPGADAPDGTPRAGRVRVLERVAATWVERASLRAPLAGADAYFGTAIAAGIDVVTGEWIAAVGAPREPSGADAADGAVHVFALRDGDWVHDARLTGDPQRDGFGALLALDGDTLVASDVAEGRAPILGAPFGRPRVLRRTPAGWETETVLDALPDLVSVAFRGDRLAAGLATALRTDGRWTFPVLVLDRIGAAWSAPTIVAEPGTAEWSRFGWSVGVDAGRLVSARFPGDADGWLGLVDSVEQRDGAWTTEQTVTVGDLRASHFPWYHGSAVVLRGDTLVVAAAIPALLTVHRHDGSAWRRDRVLSQALPRGYADAGGGPEHFRAAVAYDGRTLAGGWVVPYWSSNPPTGGRVLVYDVVE